MCRARQHCQLCFPPSCAVCDKLLFLINADLSLIQSYLLHMHYLCSLVIIVPYIFFFSSLLWSPTGAYSGEVFTFVLITASKQNCFLVLVFASKPGFLCHRFQVSVCHQCLKVPWQHQWQQTCRHHRKRKENLSLCWDCFVLFWLNVLCEWKILNVSFVKLEKKKKRRKG